MSRETFSAAPPLSVAIGLSVGIFAVLFAVRAVQPWLLANVPPHLPLACTAPKDEASLRVVYLRRRGEQQIAECGPVVGGQPARKAAR